MQPYQQARPPRGQLRGIWDALRTQLRLDGSDLRRCVRTYQLAEGQDSDLITPEAWDASMLPVLRLDLSSGGGSWQNQVTTHFQLRASITLGIPGTDQGDALDWWESVVRQLYPGDRSFSDRIYLFGARSYTLTEPAVSPHSMADGIGQIITGAFTLLCELGTKV